MYVFKTQYNSVRSTCRSDAEVEKMMVMIRAGTNTRSDEYDTYREYRLANTNMYSRIHFFSEAKLGNGLSVLVYACTMYSAQKFHFASLVYYRYCLFECNYSSFAVRTTSLHHHATPSTETQTTTILALSTGLFRISSYVVFVIVVQLS